MDATLLLAAEASPARATIGRLFRNCGFQIETADSAEECLQKSRALNPEIVAVDVDLPGGFAAQAVMSLDQGRRYADTPVVFFIGCDAPEVLARTTGLSRACCFQKPLDLDDLVDRVGFAIALIDLWRSSSPSHKSCKRRSNRRSRSASKAWGAPSVKTGAQRSRKPKTKGGAGGGFAPAYRWSSTPRGSASLSSRRILRMATRYMQTNSDPYEQTPWMNK